MRNVVITGAGSGLGRVTAEQFAAAGDRVFACDVAADPLHALKAAGVAALAQVADVSIAAEVEAFFAAVWSITERVDVLINNVGVPGPRVPLEKIELRDWAHTLDANLNGAFWTIRQVLPGMKQHRSGVILNVTTVSVRTLPEWRAPYIVSKAALESLSRAIAREAGPFNVRCNAVQPGLMDNDRLARILRRVAEQSGKSVDAVEQEQLQFVSMRAKVAMSEVAAMLHYLASDAARHVTGQVIAVDGGVQWEG
jgi:NAD(P)-dependent dehydrogenase (short-subunit alcohol dehydrogenase family)